jgi:hypothetical protein
LWCLSKTDDDNSRFNGFPSGGSTVTNNLWSLFLKKLTFLGKRAGKLSALWQNEQEVGGGSFINYCFYDEYSERIYMLDYALYYPRLDKRKRSYLRKGEIILHTFRTKNQDAMAKL